MRVAVVGAGIGGLVTAIGLQADGHDVTVYEQREDAGAIGAGLTLFGNAFAALDAIGLGDQIRQISTDALGRIRSGQRRPSGRWLLCVPPSDQATVRSLHRADLHGTLTPMLDAGSLRLRTKVTVPSDGRPMVRTDSHAEAFDLVVAADGLRSDTRRRWGLDRGLRYAGYTAWRGITASRGHWTDEVGETWGRGARFGMVPLPDGRVYWYATRSTVPDAELGEAHEFLLNHFAVWHSPIREMISGTPAADVLRHDIYDLARMPQSFIHGRGVLLGDAAHAMTPDLGQGAGQAIEDAVTLVLLVRKSARNHSVDLDSVLRRYDRLRRPRTQEFWRRSRAVGRIAQMSNPLGANVRDAVLYATPATVMTPAMNRLHQWPEV